MKLSKTIFGVIAGTTLAAVSAPAMAQDASTDMNQQHQSQNTTHANSAAAAGNNSQNNDTSSTVDMSQHQSQNVAQSSNSVAEQNSLLPNYKTVAANATPINLGGAFEDHTKKICTPNSDYSIAVGFLGFQAKTAGQCQSPKLQPQPQP